ncbi:MAG: CapA family protein [Rhodobacter sp.]|nr:CapA family protein [Rhodobacter sp.]
MTPNLRLFLAGDVMVGRGIDQILPHPGDPTLYESYLNSAADYVALAERRCGAIPRAVRADYVWGDLVSDLQQRHCDLRLVNLETAITATGRPEPKGINYRMHPANASVLTAAGIDACILANNHVLDWGRPGLAETLQVLKDTGVAQSGAGHTRDEAATPLVLTTPGKPRVLLLAYAALSSGVPSSWAAGPQMPGVNLLPADLDETIAAARASLGAVRQDGDVVIISLHWGGNWGYRIDPEERALAHALIDTADVDIVYGHSSHHPKAMEVHSGKLILYGCGDLINDYEGIGGHDQYRSDLVLAYVVDLLPKSGTLGALTMIPYRIHAFRLKRADAGEAQWLADMLDRECLAFGGHVSLAPDLTLLLSR